MTEILVCGTNRFVKTLRTWFQTYRTVRKQCQNDPLNASAMRLKRYDNIDGTGEMFFGFMMLGFTLLSWLQTLIPKDSLWHNTLGGNLGFTYLVLGCALGAGWLVRWAIKRWLTWPRTGYAVMPTAVKPRPEDAPVVKRARWFGLMIPAIVGGLVAVVATAIALIVARERQHPDSFGWVATVGYVGYLFFWVPLYAFFIRQVGGGHGWKWIFVGLMTLGLAGIGIRGGGGSFHDLGRPVMGLVGSVWMLSGLTTLVVYLWQHPRPEPEAK